MKPSGHNRSVKRPHSNHGRRKATRNTFVTYTLNGRTFSKRRDAKITPAQAARLAREGLLEMTFAEAFALIASLEAKKARAGATQRVA